MIEQPLISIEFQKGQEKFETKWRIITTKTSSLTLIKIVTSERSLISTELEDGKDNQKHNET